MSNVLFVPRGTNISYTKERGGTNISHTQEGGTNIFHTQGGDNLFHTHRGVKHFCILWVGTNIFASRGGGQTFFVGGGSGYDDVDEEINESEASKLSAGARIFRGP